MELVLRNETVSLQDYKEFRSAVGWASPPDDAIAVALGNCEYCITAYSGKNPAGMGRIVGDKGFIYFIADIIVKPEYQGRGIGSMIMESIMTYLKTHAPKNAYITLMAAEGKEGFYEKFGFFKRPCENYGCGMMIQLG